MCPDTSIVGHCSSHLTSAQRFTIRAHYILVPQPSSLDKCAVRSVLLVVSDPTEENTEWYKYVVRLDPEERAQLLALVNTGRAAAVKLLHARILLQSRCRCRWSPLD